MLVRLSVRFESKFCSKSKIIKKTFCSFKFKKAKLGVVYGVVFYKDGSILKGYFDGVSLNRDCLEDSEFFNNKLQAKEFLQKDHHIITKIGENKIEFKIN